MNPPIRTARSPGGETFTVVVAPPGSALDSDDAGPPLLQIFSMIRGGMTRRWRVVVREEAAGRSPQIIYRQSFGTAFAAEADADRVAAALTLGERP